MAIEEIPRAFKYTCDRCGAVHLNENASGHYANSRPPGWSTLKFNQSIDMANVNSIGVNIEKLLCQECGATIKSLLDKGLQL